MTNQALPDLQRVCVGVTGCNIIRETRNGDDIYVREEDEMIRFHRVSPAQSEI